MSSLQAEDIVQASQAVPEQIKNEVQLTVFGQDKIGEQEKGGSNTLTIEDDKKQIRYFDPDRPFLRQPVDVDLMLYTLERKSKKKQQLIEMCVYIPFIVVVILYLTFSTLIDDAYYMNWGLKDLFLDEEFPNIDIRKDFHDIMNPTEFFQWIDGPLVNGLFNEDYYTGNKKSAVQQRYIQLHNRYFGSMRIRQHRVGNSSCSRTPYMPINATNFDPGCYDEFDSASKIDKTPFGPNNTWTYLDCKETGGGISYSGKRYSYPCGGHTLFLSLKSTKDEAAAFFKKLKDNLWIDKQTRLTIIEFYSYNQNLNYFVRIQLVVEWAEGGSCIPQWNFRVFKVETFRTPGDYVWFAFSMILPIYVFFFSYQWFRGLYMTHKAKGWYHYLFDVWHIIEIVNYGFFVATFVLRAMWFVHPQRTNFRIVAPGYPNLDELANVYVIDLQVAGISMIITCFKVLKFFSLSDKLNLIIRTIERAFASLVSTTLMLAILLIAFVFSGNLLFGMDVFEFKDLATTFSSLLRGLVGGDGVEFEEVFNESREAWPLYAFLFTVFGEFLIMNFFDAVLIDTFGEVNSTTLDDGVIDPDQLREAIGELGSVMKKKDILQLLKLRQRTDEEAAHAEVETSAQFDHGDEAIVERLVEYQESVKGGQPLFADDIRVALGSDASRSLVDRIMARYDADGSGSIEVSELIDPITGELRLAARNEDGTINVKAAQEAEEAKEMQAYAERISKMEKHLETFITLLDKYQK